MAERRRVWSTSAAYRDGLYGTPTTQVAAADSAGAEAEGHGAQRGRLQMALDTQRQRRPEPALGRVQARPTSATAGRSRPSHARRGMAASPQGAQQQLRRYDARPASAVLASKRLTPGCRLSCSHFIPRSLGVTMLGVVATAAFVLGATHLWNTWVKPAPGPVYVGRYHLALGRPCWLLIRAPYCRAGAVAGPSRHRSRGWNLPQGSRSRLRPSSSP